MHGSHEKHKIVIRYWLQGKEWHRALRAMDFAENVHTGLRKDGKTPEFAHQLWIANVVRTLSPMLIHPEETIATAFLHDTIEDYNLGLDTATGLFGVDIAAAVWTVSKIRGGAKLSDHAYYDGLAGCPIASIVKLVDRTHNVGSMVGVFTRAKQEAYLAETREFVMPLIKKARRRFTQQELAYENVKQILLSRTALIEEIHAASDR